MSPSAPGRKERRMTRGGSQRLPTLGLGPDELVLKSWTVLSSASARLSGTVLARALERAPAPVQAGLPHVARPSSSSDPTPVSACVAREDPRCTRRHAPESSCSGHQPGRRLRVHFAPIGRTGGTTDLSGIATLRLQRVGLTWPSAFVMAERARMRVRAHVAGTREFRE
jgi:hypothetical protein